MKKIFVYVFLFCLCLFVSVYYCWSEEMQSGKTESSIQNWLQDYNKHPRDSYACSISIDATTLAIGNNIDRIWIADLTTKRLMSVIHHDFGGFRRSMFILNDDGTKLSVRNDLIDIYPAEVRDKLPIELLANDWLMCAKSFWIYDTKRGSLIKRLDVVPVSCTQSGRIVSDAEIDAANKLNENSGTESVRTKITTLGNATMTINRGGHFAPFCFSNDSSSLFTTLYPNGANFCFNGGVIAENIDIKSNTLKQVYMYSDYDKVREYLTKGIGPFGSVYGLVRSGDGKYLVLLGEGGGNFALFETTTGKVVSAHREFGGKYNFTLNYSGSLLARQVSTYKTHPQAEKLRDDEKGDFHFNDTRGCKIEVSDTRTAKKKIELITPDPLIITNIAFSKDDKYIVAGTIWGHVFVWATSNGKLVQRFSLTKDQKNSKDTTTTIIGFCENSDDLIVVYIGRHNKTAQVYKHRVSDEYKEKLFVFPP